MSQLLQDLNEQQLEAVTTTEGPLLIIAGAGSGKTRVLTRRLAYILSQRLAEPYQILAVTFTNKAAGEMRDRVAEQFGGEIHGLQVSTFHSFCARFLRQEAGELDYDQKFTIFDSADSVTLMKNCIKQLGLSVSQFAPKAQLHKISAAKNKLISADQFLQHASGYFEKSTAELYRLYQRRLRECNGMDFDDLLFNTVMLLKNNDKIGERYRNRFKYLLVDEYQDTNHVQYMLLKLLLGEHKNICVVGDEDQSIYGWRGADISNILNFEQDYKGAKIIKLEQNYRSTKIILNAASSVIKHNDARKDKTLWTDVDGGEKIKLLLVDSAEEEAIKVVDQIDEARVRFGLKQQVILYRTNAQSRAFEEKLRRLNLPYQIIGGLGFYQRKEIKDIMAYLKLIVNIKDDVSFQRVINYPKRGIGDKTVADIARVAAGAGLSCYEVLLKIDNYPELASRKSRLESFAKFVESLREKIDTDPVDLLTQDLVDGLNLLNELKNEDEITGQTRIENVEALIEGMAEYAHHNGDNSLINYLAEITLYTDLDSYKEIEDKITMMTIHAAKGLEFDCVYIVGMEEGLFPIQRSMNDPMELEEERRLFYVAATRARKELFLASATTRFRFGEVESIPSRFLAEIPDELIETKDMRRRRAWDRTVSQPAPSFFGSSSPAPHPKEPTPSGVHYEFEENEIMREGRIVSHPTFGRGTIVKVEGFGESLRLEVMFAGIGIKKIMAKYARLKIIG